LRTLLSITRRGRTCDATYRIPGSAATRNPTGTEVACEGYPAGSTRTSPATRAGERTANCQA